MNNPNAQKEDVFIIDVSEEDLHFIDRELDSNFQLSSESDEYLAQLYSSQHFNDAAYTQSYLTQIESGSLAPSYGDLPIEAPVSSWSEGHTPTFQDVLTELSNSGDLDMLTRF